MSDVTRHVRDVQMVVYTVGAETVRSVVMAHLYDEHGAAFTPETVVEFYGDGSMSLATEYAASCDRSPEHESAAPQGFVQGDGA